MLTKNLANTVNIFANKLEVDNEIKLNGQNYLFPDNSGATNFILSTNGSGILDWIPASAAAGSSTSISALLDVELVGLSNNQILKYNSSTSKWNNVTLVSGDIGLGNVTNESKTTMFNNSIFTGITTIPELSVNTIARFNSDIGVNLFNSGNTFSINLLPNAGLSNNLTFRFPANNGLSGYILETDGAGVTSWVQKLLSSNADVSFTVLNNNDYLRYNSGTQRWVNSAINASTVGLGNVTNESKTTMFNNPIFTGTVTSTTIENSGNISILSENALRLNNLNNTFYSQLKAGNNSGNLTFTLPINYAGNEQFLTSNSSGVLSWSGYSIAGATDSNIISPQPNQTLFYTAGKWQNQYNRYNVLNYSVNANLVLTEEYEIINLNTTGSYQITLPSISSVPGHTYIFVKTNSSGVVSLVTTGIDRIGSNLTSINLTAQYQSLTLIANGNPTQPVWIII